MKAIKVNLRAQVNGPILTERANAQLTLNEEAIIAPNSLVKGIGQRIPGGKDEASGSGFPCMVDDRLVKPQTSDGGTIGELE